MGIPRNTTVPTSKSETFSTASDGQTSVEINVLQGERDFVKDNKSLGNFRLDGIPPAPRGSPKIEVKFDIDANCILSVTATDKGSGKKADIKITGASTLAAEDEAKREAIEAKNQGEALVYQTRKQISEFGEKISEQLKNRVEDKIKELENALNSGDKTEILSKTDALQREVVEIGQAIYGQQGSPSTAQDATTDSSKRESTV